MMQKEIKLPNEFTSEHTSMDYLKKLIGKKIFHYVSGSGYVSDEIIELSEIMYNNSFKISYREDVIKRLRYECVNGSKFELDYIIAVMLIEGGYAEDAIGFKYGILD